MPSDIVPYHQPRDPSHHASPLQYLTLKRDLSRFVEDRDHLPPRGRDAAAGEGGARQRGGDGDGGESDDAGGGRDRQISKGTSLHFLPIPSKHWRPSMPVVVLEYDELAAYDPSNSPTHPQPSHSQLPILTSPQLLLPALSSSSTESDESQVHLGEAPLLTVQVLGIYSSGFWSEVTHGELWNAAHPNQQIPVAMKTYWLDSMASLI
ncbi:hypothetical protein C8J57DRAFT_1500363 [Mycena rebaudengoi]|nr:hypothetical protein C8J57DRAFT_1500363 [Mycena rebaudengoi]